MSMRNPMNERYSSDKPTGVSRKSAASAKPKSQAASSVIIQQSLHTEKERKALKKEADQKRRNNQRVLEDRYHEPNTPEYKRMKTFWWCCMATGLASILAATFLAGHVSGEIQTAFLILAAVSVATGLIFDATKMRTKRREYQQRVGGIRSKAVHQAEKQRKAEEKAAIERGKEKAAAEEAEKQAKRQAKKDERAARKKKGKKDEDAGEGE